MRWTGMFRAMGYYKLSDGARTWELRHRAESRQEPAGWYLYGGDGAVVAEWMAEKVGPAQKAAERFVSAYRPAEAADRAVSDAHDETWQKLMGEAL